MCIINMTITLFLHPSIRFPVLEGMVKSLVEYDLQLISLWKDVQVIELNF